MNPLLTALLTNQSFGKYIVVFTAAPPGTTIAAPAAAGGGFGGAVGRSILQRRSVGCALY